MNKHSQILHEFNKRRLKVGLKAFLLLWSLYSFSSVWANNRPSSFVSLGSEIGTYGIIVEKKIGKLSVFQLTEDGSYALVKTYQAITGKNQGDKLFRGDNRTPEGIYFIVGEKPGSELQKLYGDAAKKYGPYAYFLDYPNIYDKLKRKTGSGIWIHGVDYDDRMLKGFDTEGCVALYNHDVLDLKKYIQNFKTPVVIVHEMRERPFEELGQQKRSALEMVDNWLDSWRTARSEIYGSFYSSHFQTLGRNRVGWVKFKEMLHRLATGQISIEISEPKILAFNDQLLLLFFQKYDSPLKQDFGKKFLYLSKENDEYKIIAEKWYYEEYHPRFATLLKKNVSLSGDQTPLMAKAALAPQTEHTPSVTKNAVDAKEEKPSQKGFLASLFRKEEYKEEQTEPSKLKEATAKESEKPLSLISQVEAKAPAAAEAPQSVFSKFNSQFEPLPGFQFINFTPLDLTIRHKGGEGFTYQNAKVIFDEKEHKLSLSFEIMKPKAGSTKVSGHLCVIVEHRDHALQYLPLNASVKITNRTIQCEKGEFFRFGWLRSSHFEITNVTDPNNIKDIKILYNLKH
jgi:murein L,D-transpeptidase YafK